MTQVSRRELFALRWPDGRVTGWVLTERLAHSLNPGDAEVVRSVETVHRTPWEPVAG